MYHIFYSSLTNSTEQWWSSLAVHIPAHHFNDSQATNTVKNSYVSTNGDKTMKLKLWTATLH